jgi:hypothetical protein
MTSTRRLGPGWAMTALRRAISTLRYVNDELTRANEALLFRPVGPPRAHRPGSATHPTTPANAGSGGATRQPAPARAGAGGAGWAASACQPEGSEVGSGQGMQVAGHAGQP